MKNWRKYKNNSKMEGERKKKKCERRRSEKSVRRHAQTFLEKFEVPETLITK